VGAHRLLAIEALEAAGETGKLGRPKPPDRFRATIYDYDASQALIVEGRTADPTEVRLVESAEQPAVTSGEFAEAVPEDCRENT
jgi:hypothetical protein